MGARYRGVERVANARRTSVGSVGTAAALFTACWFAAPAFAVAVGDVDTFETSLENWSAGGGPSGSTPPVPPYVVADGGPEGAGDAFLLITARGGQGPGSRLSAMNILGQWAGDYLDAGIGGISADLRNFGQTPLTVRLFFEDPIPLPPQNEAVTLLGVTLAPGSNWTHAFFPIASADLAALVGSATTVLGHTTVLRIINAEGATEATPVVGLLGVDNIRAEPAAVPEPASVWLLVAGVLAWLGRFGRSGRARRAGTQ